LKGRQPEMDVEQLVDALRALVREEIERSREDVRP
jgi:hypothetical protein